MLSTADCSVADLGAFVPGTEVRLAGAAEGPLKGLLFAAKDNFDVAGFVTGCGNPDWARTHPPAAAHADAVAKLLGAGADLAGKTITDELAYSLAGQNPHYGTPVNPAAPGRIPGGSSSGSASAVAGGIVDFALGSDTGGSVRIPASYCGLFGMRPTHGRISVKGLVPASPFCDTVGWFARTAFVLRQVGEVLYGVTAKDDIAVSELLLAEDAFGLLDPAVRAVLTPHILTFEARFGRARAIDVAQPAGSFAKLIPSCRILQGREIWRQHGAWIETARPRLGPEAQGRFAWARGLTAAAEAEAGEVQDDLADSIHKLVSGNRLLLLPTAPDIAPLTTATAEELSDYRDRALGLTAISSLSGVPQITLPLVTLEGCPLGLSIIGAAGRDLDLLRLAEMMTGGGFSNSASTANRSNDNDN